MRDVIGYEEKSPETLAKLDSGYPRFVLHQHLRQIESHWQRLFEKPDARFWPTSSEKMAKRLQARLGSTPSKLIKHRGVSAIRIQDDPQTNLEAKSFLQHVGGFLSSRQAEDYLFAEGVISEKQAEVTYEGDSENRILDELEPLLGVDRENIVFSNSGMNAFYAAFEAVRSVQEPEGRTNWVKLGWLYSDTMHILDKLGAENSNNIELMDVLDLDALESKLEECGSTVAGIVTETPTNPLIQTVDLQRIRNLATKHGAYLIVDPTVASPANIDVSPYADIIVNSLTKYAANEGDVLLGLNAITKNCPRGEEILNSIRENVEAPYSRDLDRLAQQIGGYGKLTEKINQSMPIVARFLEQHPKVASVYWAKQEQTRANFEKISRSPDSCAGLLSFELNSELATFLDATPLPKGPSFGMRSTLLCPYIYLAHYSLVSCEEGRKELLRCGINPELLRLSVGDEPAEEIISALEIGLNAKS